MEQKLQDFLKDLVHLSEDNLISVVLYGSSAGEGFVKEHSDVNILIVLKEITGEKTARIHDIIRKNIKAIRLNPVFITKNELKNSLDVFPLEFLEIKEGYKVIQGKDLISRISVSTANLKHQIEYEIRSKLITLRKAWFSVRDDKQTLKSLLVRYGTSFNILLKYAGKVPGNKKACFNRDILESIQKIKKNEIKTDKGTLNKLFWELHGFASELTYLIDKIK